MINTHFKFSLYYCNLLKRVQFFEGKVNQQTMDLHKFFDNNGARMHYIDQGMGDAIVMLHGNPTWSYFYRSLISGLSKRNRVIVPDHIGMGLSDKPQCADYSLAYHIDNLERLIEHLKLKDITLIVHDWGGAIGFGYAVRHLRNVKKIVVLNSAAYFDTRVAWWIALCRSCLGSFLVRRMNLFAKAATRMAPHTKLPKEIRSMYLKPYDTFDNRIGIYTFLRDIPMKKEHRTRHILDSIESGLAEIKSEILILWGAKDFCFTKHFYERWKAFFPHAKTKLYQNAGHYILEDIPSEALKEIEEFLR